MSNECNVVLEKRRALDLGLHQEELAQPGSHHQAVRCGLQSCSTRVLCLRDFPDFRITILFWVKIPKTEQSCRINDVGQDCQLPWTSLP